MKIKPLLLVASASAAALLAAMLPTAHAQFAKAEDEIKYRKAAFTIMGTHMGRVGAMVQGKMPFDAKAASENIAAAAAVMKMPYTAFSEGSDLGDTKAKHDIWKEKAKFDEGARKMQAEMSKLVDATKSGNFTLDQLKTAFGPVGQSCKACHDNYREK